MEVVDLEVGEEVVVVVASEEEEGAVANAGRIFLNIFYKKNQFNFYI